MDVNYGVLKRLDGLSQFQMVNFFSIFYQISTDSIWYLIERFCSWTTLTMWTDPRGSIFESFSTDKDWASMTSCNLFKFSLSLIYLRLAGLRSWCIYFTCIKTIPQLKNRRVSKSKLFHLVERMVSPRRSFFLLQMTNPTRLIQSIRNWRSIFRQVSDVIRLLKSLNHSRCTTMNKYNSSCHIVNKLELNISYCSKSQSVWISIVKC